MFHKYSMPQTVFHILGSLCTKKSSVTRTSSAVVNCLFSVIYKLKYLIKKASI